MKGIITISFDENGISVCNSMNRRYDPVELSEEERRAIEIIEAAVSSEPNSHDPIHLERRTDKYLTVVVCGVYDFCRVKIGKRSMWVSVSLSPTDRELFLTDARFANELNKNQIHWKIALASVDSLKNCSDLIQKSYLWAVQSAQAAGS